MVFVIFGFLIHRQQVESDFRGALGTYRLGLLSAKTLMSEHAHLERFMENSR
jgi:hypothetical protein